MAGIFRRAWFPPQKRRFSPNTTTANISVFPGLGVVAVVGFAPAVIAGTSAAPNPGVGTVTITGFAPTFSNGTGYAGQPGAGAVTVTGYAPTVVSQPPAVTPGMGSVVIQGHVPTITGMAGVALTPGAGRVSIFGYAPTVSGAPELVGGSADPRRKWLDWKARQKRKPVKAEIRRVDTIPPGTLSFMELLSFLDRERQAELARPALSQDEQALDDADVERLLMEEA